MGVGNKSKRSVHCAIFNLFTCKRFHVSAAPLAAVATSLIEKRNL